MTLSPLAIDLACLDSPRPGSNFDIDKKSDGWVVGDASPIPPHMWLLSPLDPNAYGWGNIEGSNDCVSLHYDYNWKPVDNIASLGKEVDGDKGGSCTSGGCQNVNEVLMHSYEQFKVIVAVAECMEVLEEVLEREGSGGMETVRRAKEMLQAAMVNRTGAKDGAAVEDGY
ncbi:hypothetical protein CC2G_000222 [Coprinopsis cinerea AmutBmut pab1-1]|nr:hypothetical protein CC2G_000222 [Coprinopsis cinerea AmutBmut pab1-1]